MRYSELIENIDSDDDDLFGDRGNNWVHAIAKTLSQLVKEAKHYMTISDPVGDVTRRTDMRIAMQDCKMLAQALREGGIQGFMSALDNASRDTIDSLDAVMATAFNVHLADIEKGFGYHDHLDEEDTDTELFGQSRTKPYEYEVYQCSNDDPFDWVSHRLFRTDNMGEAHGYAYDMWKTHPENSYMIWQPRTEGSRGSYGPVNDRNEVTEDDDDDLFGSHAMMSNNYELVDDVDGEVLMDIYNKSPDEALEIAREAVRQYPQWASRDPVLLRIPLSDDDYQHSRYKRYPLDEDDELFGSRGRDRVIEYIGSEVERLRQEKQLATDPEEKEWISDELADVLNIYRTMEHDFQAGMDALMSESGSSGWADSLIIGMQEAGINVEDIYNAPWLQEDDESDDELFGAQGNIVNRVAKLLKGKQKVISKMMGAMGVIYDVSSNGAFGLKPLNKPYSKMRYSWGPFSPDKLQDFYLVNNHERGHWELRSREQDAALAQSNEG